MSIFIPNRSIKLPRDISVPQGLSPSIFETHRRDQAFQLSKRFDGALVDVVSGAKSTSVISGVRYGIVNGVVTEFGVNQPALEDDGFRGCPAFTQLANTDFTSVYWGKGRINTITTSGESVYGQPTYVYTETTDGDGSHYIDQNLTYVTTPTDNSVLGICFIAKRRIQGRNVEVVLKCKDSNDTRLVLAQFDLTNGSVTVSKGATATIQSIGNGYYKCFASRSANAGASAPYFYFRLLNSSKYSYYYGDGVSGINIGMPIIVNFGVAGTPFIPPYVPNNTTGSISVVSETGSATNGTSFDLDNTLLARLKTALRGPNAQGHLELTFKSNFDSGRLTNDTIVNILSTNNANTSKAPLYFTKNSSGILYFEGSDNYSWMNVIIPSVLVGQIFKISIDYGSHSTGQKMRLTVNGVKSSLVNFSGSFGTHDLRFFFGNTAHAGWIVKDSLKVMDRPRW